MPSVAMLFASMMGLLGLAYVFCANVKEGYIGIETNIEKDLLPTNANKGKFLKHKEVPVPIPIGEDGDALEKTLSHMHKTRMFFENNWPREPIRVTSGHNMKGPAHRLQTTSRAFVSIFDTLKRWFGVNRIIAFYHRRAAIRDIIKAIDYEVKVVKHYKWGEEAHVQWALDEWIKLIENALWHQERAESAGNGKIELLALKYYVDRRMKRILFAQENGFYHQWTGMFESPMKWEEDQSES